MVLPDVPNYHTIKEGGILVSIKLASAAQQAMDYMDGEEGKDHRRRWSLDTMGKWNRLRRWRMQAM